MRLILSALCSASLLISTSALAQTPAPIAPHCQKMMMIGCALTKNSKGRNAPAAANECAELLKQGECGVPATGMPSKIVKMDKPYTPPEEDKPKSAPRPTLRDFAKKPKVLTPKEEEKEITEEVKEEVKEDVKEEAKEEAAAPREEPKKEEPKEEAKSEEKEETKEEPKKEEVKTALPEPEPDAASAIMGVSKDPLDVDAMLEKQALSDAAAMEEPVTVPPKALIEKTVIPAEEAPDLEATTDAPKAETVDTKAAAKEAPVDATEIKAMDNALGESELEKPPTAQELLENKVAEEAAKEEAPKNLAPMVDLPEAVPAPVKVEESTPAHVVELAPADPTAAPTAAAAVPAPEKLPSEHMQNAAQGGPIPEVPSTADAPSILDSASSPMSFSFGTTVLVPGDENKVTFYLRRTDNNSPVTFQDLKEVNGEKLQLLIIDPSLKEYHHITPVAGSQAGEYTFNFKPEGSFFRVFADVTTIGKDENLVLAAALGVKPVEKATIDTVTRYDSSDGGTVSAVLSFDGPLKAGTPLTGTIKLVDSMGTPIKNLEPIMERFGHIAAFSQKLDTPLRIDPIGMKPLSANDRGGPELQFRFEPRDPGFVRLVLSVKIGGKQIVIPFGFTVQ